MPPTILYVGILFWFCMVLFGTRAKFATALPGPLAALRSGIGRAGLIALGLAGAAAGFALAHVEVRQIAEKAGLIGPYFMMGAACAIGGAVLLSAGTVQDGS